MKYFFMYLAVISLISVIVCILDKHRARLHGRRIRERTLFIICFLGGSVAMYVTMQLIRHKTRHMSFMLGIPLIIALQALILYAIETFS